MNTEQREVVKENMPHVAQFLIDKIHRLILKNHVIASSAGIDIRQLQGEMEVMHKDKFFDLRFELNIRAVPK